MKNSFILRTVFNICEKLLIYYKNSGFYQILHRTGKGFERLGAGSSILSFFDREWSIGSAWKQSRIFGILILPFKLLKHSSNRLADRTNSTLEGSRALSGMRTLLESLFNISSRVYGLLFLTFAVTQGILDFAFNYGELLFGMRGIIRLMLFVLGTVMILINRPVNVLVKSSIVGRISYDFFIVRGLKDGTDNKV